MNNSSKTFKDFDKFDLEEFADDLTKYLEIEHKFIDESLVLSLNSEFGSGKSTFFEMWKNQLKSSESKFEVSFLNAWQEDYIGNPLLAIVFHLLDDIEMSYEQKEKIKDFAGKLGKFGLSVGNDIVQKFTGADIIKATRYSEDKEKHLSDYSCFGLYEEKRTLFNKLKEQLRSLAKQSAKPILIIVDELDRCRPNYAIEFLETVKHFFDIKNLIFVIGVDKSQLESSAKALFGQGLDFNEYYRKFAHRNVDIPVTSKNKTKKFFKSLLNEYCPKEGKSGYFKYAKLDEITINRVAGLSEKFSLNARQIHEVLRIAAHIMSKTGESNRSLKWGWEIGTFFMILLSIRKHDIYRKIGNEIISFTEFTQFFKETGLYNQDNEFWPLLLYTGVFGLRGKDKIMKEFSEIGFKTTTLTTEQKNDWDEKFQRINKEFFEFGHSNSPTFPEIYKKIESFKTFEKS
jgi:hypothetical protein